MSTNTALLQVPGCPLCATPGTVVFTAASFRVVRADEPGFPAFYRVVWASHVAEFSDLDAAQRTLCIEAVVQVEQALRKHLAPTKINIAALGNQVPHLHWHVIARFDTDSHFPDPVWAAPRRPRSMAHEAAVAARLPALQVDMVAGLAAWVPASQPHHALQNKPLN